MSYRRYRVWHFISGGQTQCAKPKAGGPYGSLAMSNDLIK